MLRAAGGSRAADAGQASPPLPTDTGSPPNPTPPPVPVPVPQPARLRERQPCTDSGAATAPFRGAGVAHYMNREACLSWAVGLRRVGSAERGGRHKGMAARGAGESRAPSGSCRIDADDII
jgi:hypothetical protein